MKKRYLTISEIISFIFVGLYALLAAFEFSLRNNLYILFVVLMVMSLCIGLYLPNMKNDMEDNTLDKKNKIILIIITVLSIINFPACLFNLFALIDNRKDKFIKLVNDEYEDVKKEPKKLLKSSAFILTIISLGLIIVGALAGWLTESVGTSVKITEHTLTKKDSDKYNKGQSLGVEFAIDDPTVSISWTEYKPKKASATNPYPVILVLPGFTRTKASMSQYAIEFARRGAVVYTIDPGSQGATTYGGYEMDENGDYILDSNGNKKQNSYSVARSGMGYLLTYLYNNVEEFDYIDRDQIGIIGHSAGGGDACKLAADFAGDTYEDSIIKALYISGYIKTSAANVFKDLRCNAALSYAKYDEGSFRYQDKNQSYEIIALRFINEVKNSPTSFFNTYENYIEDYAYGNMDEGTYRILHQELTNHCFEMYDIPSIANTINFFKIAFKLNTKLSDNSQIWPIQEIGNGISLVAAFMLIISVMSLIVNYVPFMKSLKAEANEKCQQEEEIRIAYATDLYTRVAHVEVPQRKMTYVKRLLFWLPMILTAIIACLDYIPLARLSMDLFPEAAGNTYTFKFPARMMNAVFLWAVVNGLVGLILFFGITSIENLVYTIVSKIKGTENKADWSKFKALKVKPLNLLKSLGLAVVLFLLFYGVLEIVYLTTHQDFRFMLISASPLNLRFLLTWLIYLAGFYIFYISNSIRVNLSIGREGLKEWQVILVGGLANSLGLVFIIIINYWSYFKTGTVYYGFYSATDLSEMWLYINMVFGLIPMMFILSVFNRLAYKRLGNVYSGALLWCMIFIMMSLSASISFIPM